MNKVSSLLAGTAMFFTTTLVAQKSDTVSILPNGVIITITKTNDSIWENFKKTDSLGSTTLAEFPSVDSLLALGEDFERNDAALIENTESLAPEEGILEKLKAQEIVIDDLVHAKHISDSILQDDILSKINEDYPDYGTYSTYQQNQIFTIYLQEFPGVPNRKYYPLPPQTEWKTKE